VRTITGCAIMIGLASVLACSDSDNPAAPPPPTVPKNVSFAKHVQPIFDARCAVTGCHVAPNPPAGLVLTKGESYANIVNVPTQVFTPGVRVTPGDASQSVLYVLVDEGQMPASGPPLTSVQVQTIKKWIEDGALDN